MKFISIKVILTVCVLFTCVGSTSCSSTNKANTSQNSTSQERDTESVFTIVYTSPRYPGRIGSITKYFSDNLQYPEEAKRLKIEGQVQVDFIVTKNGDVKDVKVIKGIGGGCDEEAVRLIKESGKWIAATERGEKIDKKQSEFINFKLKK